MFILFITKVYKMFFRPIYAKEANLNFLNWSRLWDIGQHSYVAKEKNPITKKIPLYLSDEKPAISLLEKAAKVIVYSSIIVGSATITPYLLLIPAIQLAAHAIFCLANRSLFERGTYNGDFYHDLKVWLHDPSVTGRKAEAKERILDAYEQKLTSLDLANLNLSSLPPIFAHLTQLKELTLYYNQLTSLPAEIGQLTQLEELDLSSNQLTFLPAEIGQLTQLQRLSLSLNRLTFLPAEIGQLTQLQRLSLSLNRLTSLPVEIGQLTELRGLDLHCNKLSSLPTEIGQLIQLLQLDLIANQLTSLPVEVGQLTHLQRLKLSNNKLTSLPTEIGNLVQLEIFEVYYNKGLQNLPLTFSALHQLTYIDIEDTAIDQVQLENLQNAWQRARALRGAINFENRFEFWLKTAAIAADPETISSFSQEEKGLLNEWLLRLEKIKDYQNCQQRLAKIVCEMVHSLKELPEFKESFFLQVENDNNSCQDRAAMSFNLLYTAWRMQKLPEASSVKEKLTLIQRAAKTEALRAYIANCIDSQQKKSGSLEHESVEIYLYYETALRKKLNLLTAIDQMTYGQIGKRSWIEKQSAIQFVEENYLKFFYSHPSLRKLALEQTQVKLKVEKAQKQAFKNLSDAPSQDELSEAYLNWQTEQNQIRQELEETTHAICQAWAKEQISAT